jgi:hypothetical protein
MSDVQAHYDEDDCCCRQHDDNVHPTARTHLLKELLALDDCCPTFRAVSEMAFKSLAVGVAQPSI